MTAYLTRRQILSSAVSLVAFGVETSAAGQADSLRSAADQHGLSYGVAVSSSTLSKDNDYALLVAREANLLVCEGETKRNVVQPSPDVYDFTGTDRVLQFASDHKQQMRGHTLVWHQSNPKWLEQRLLETRDDRLLTDYVSQIVGRYKHRFHSWDVVNEVIEPDESGPSGLRVRSIWYRAFGENFIDLAFHAARAAAPTIPLYLNEANLEADVGWSERRRSATLSLLERMLKRNVPIDGVGIQGHLKLYRLKYNEEVFSKFLDEVISMGLKVLITEFDVADIGGPASIPQIDKDAADLTSRMLGVALAKREVRGLITWGLSDKYTWLAKQPGYEWPNGQLPRSLPFDSGLRPKLVFDAVMTALASGYHDGRHP